jgi:hypothetical protein
VKTGKKEKGKKKRRQNRKEKKPVVVAESHLMSILGRNETGYRYHCMVEQPVMVALPSKVYVSTYKAGFGHLPNDR